MDIFSWLWLGWIAAFGVIEGLALARKKEGGTLSEHVWKWFGIGEAGEGRPEPTTWVWIRRVTLGGFLAWLSIHFLTGGVI